MRTAIRALLAGVLAWGVGAAAASTLLVLGLSFAREQLSDRTVSPGAAANQATPRVPAAGSPSPSAIVGTPTATPDTTERRIVSPGGTVLIRCAAAGARVVAADPAPGFRTAAVSPDPAPEVTVVFASVEDQVKVSARCESGVPRATISVDEPGDD